MSQTVWIARHANREDFVNPGWFNEAERPYDPPLSADGLVQARQLAQRLQDSGISQIFASPFLRTTQTAHIVAETLSLPLKLEWWLCEWLNPDWMDSDPQTQSLESLAAQFPRIDMGYQSRIKPKYPETERACMERTGEIARVLAASSTGDILLVGHGISAIGMTMGLVSGLAPTDIKATLCCLVKVVRQEAKWFMELNGDTSHLTQTESVIRFN